MSDPYLEAGMCPGCGCDLPTHEDWCQFEGEEGEALFDLMYGDDTEEEED